MTKYLGEQKKKEFIIFDTFDVSSENLLWKICTLLENLTFNTYVDVALSSIYSFNCFWI
jgi:hypothetical protein